MLLSAVLLSGAAARGYLGAAYSFDIGSVELRGSGPGNMDMEFDSEAVGARGVHFIGKNGHLGLFYSLDYGVSPNLWSSGGVEADCNEMTSGSIGPAIRIGLGKRLDLALGIGFFTETYGYNGGELVLSGMALDLGASYRMGSHAAMFFGAEYRSIDEMTITDSDYHISLEYGESIYPYIGLALCY